MSESIKTEYRVLSAEELVRWVERACKAEALVDALSSANGELWVRINRAEARVAKLEKVLVREERADEAWKWGWEVGIFLQEALQHKPGHSFDLTEGFRLYTDAIALGITPEPDCGPDKTWEVRPGDGCPCPPDVSEFCPKCGGRKL